MQAVSFAILPAAFLFAPISAGLVGLWTAIENIRQDFFGVWSTPQQAERIACRTMSEAKLSQRISLFR